jgi:hypothetical protein
MTFTTICGKFNLAGSFQQTLAFLLRQPVMTARAGYVQFKQG